MSQLPAVIVDGILYASWMFIIAVGLTLIYGVMKILNVAHGSMYALGAYTAATFAAYWLSHGYPPMGSYGALLVAAIVVGLIAGPLIERGLLRFMYGRDEIVLVLVTYALFLILEDVSKLVFGVDPIMVSEPYSLLGNLELGHLIYPVYSLVLVLVSVLGRCRAGIRNEPHAPRQDVARRDSRPRDEHGARHQRLARVSGDSPSE